MKLAAYASLVVVIVIGAWGLNRLWQRHLTSEVRNAFCASLSPNASESDMAHYIQAAKLASRTRQDIYVISLLDDFVHSAADKAFRQQRELDRATEGLQELSYPGPCAQYKVGTAEAKTCAENMMQEVENEKALDKLEDRQIAADEAVMNQLQPKMKAEQERYCSSPFAPN